MWGFIRWLGASAAFVGTVMIWFASNSIPQFIADADGYIVTNLKWLGWSNPPQALATEAADNWAYTAGVLLLLLGVVLLVAWLIHRYAAKPAKPMVASEPQLESPIRVLEQLYLDIDDIKNENGEHVNDHYSLAFCLCVSAAEDHPEVLRNIRARLYTIGEPIVLPIRGAERGEIDLRHGEWALVEVARRLIKAESGVVMPGLHRQNEYQTATADELKYEVAPRINNLKIKLSDALKSSTHYVGQVGPQFPYRDITVVISADNVLSKTVRMETDLSAPDARAWLTLSHESRDS